MKIRAYTGYSERSNARYYTDFEIVGKLPEVGEVIYGDSDNSVTPYHGERERVTNVCAARIDCEQGNDEVYDYEFYEVQTQFEEYNDSTERRQQSLKRQIKRFKEI